MRKEFNWIGAGLFSVLVGLALGFPSGSTGEIVDRVIANVNGEIILMSELQEIMSQTGEFSEDPEGGPSKTDARTILNSMIDEKIQVQYAKKLRFEVTEDEIHDRVDEIKKVNGLNDEQLDTALKQRGMGMEDFKNSLRDRILVGRVIRSEVDSKIRIYDREIINYYQSHPEKYLSDESVHAGHIVVLCPLKADPETEGRARTKIERAMEEIRDGKPFASVAQKYSEGPNAEKGGDLGTFKRGRMMAAFEDRVFALKAGQVSDIFRLETGFHIVKVYEKQSAGVRPLADVRVQVEDELYKEKREQRYKEWMDSLKQGSYIKTLY
jgi:peptidyl-prolyl cis-trans isomerase SurA